MSPKVPNTSSRKLRKRLQKFDQLAKTLQSSMTYQKRFSFIPTTFMTGSCVVAGIRDNQAGRINNGAPVGGNIVRFNNPSPGKKSNFYRICIDPAGVKNKANLHIPVSKGVIKAAKFVQKYSSGTLLVLSLIATGIRIGHSINEEINIDEEIAALEEIHRCLSRDLKKDSNNSETKKSLEFVSELICEAFDYKRKPGKKTILTALCIGGETGGAAVGGMAGAELGIMAGTVGGPIGSLAGAAIGGVCGAMIGSELGQSLINNFHCNEERGIGTEINGSLIDVKDFAEIVSVDSNLAVGKNGIELSTGGSVFLIDTENINLDVVKAGAEVTLTKQKLALGVTATPIRGEIIRDDRKVGVGLSLDTGVTISNDEFKCSFLGFGFSEQNGWKQIKFPFFDISYK